MLVPKELVAWWVKHHSLRLHVLFNRKNNNNNNNNNSPLNPISPYIIKKHPNDLLICTKRFPREFNKTIIINTNKYPTYRRRRIIDNEVITWNPNNRFNNR